MALKNFEESTRSGDVKQIAQADVEFHDAIYQAADNPKLVNMLNNLREQMYRYRIEYLKRPGVYPQLIAEHEEIIRRIERKEKEEACEIVCKHIDNQVEAVMNSIRTKNN